MNVSCKMNAIFLVRRKILKQLQIMSRMSGVVIGYPFQGGLRGDCMVVGFTTTCTISVYRH
jgi:hypothetical protein